MITLDQIRAARALLNWSQHTLATKAGPSLSTIKAIQAGKDARVKTMDSMTVLRARRAATGSKYLTLRGGLRRAHSVPPRSVKWVREISYSMPTNAPACLRIARRGDKSPEIILTLKLIPRDLPQEVIRFAV